MFSSESQIINAHSTIMLGSMVKVRSYPLSLSMQFIPHSDTWEAKKMAIQSKRKCHKLKHRVGELEWDKKVLENENKHLKDKLAKHEEESSWFIWMVKSGVNKLGIALLEDKNLEDAQDAGEELAQALEVIGEYTIV